MKLDHSVEQMYLAAIDSAPSDVFTLKRRRQGADGKPTTMESKVRLCLLTKDEELSAIAAAQRTARKYGETGDFRDVYRDAQSLEALAYALRKIDPVTHPDGTTEYPRIFEDSAELGKRFTAVDLAYLINCYEALCETYKSLEDLTPENVELWVSRLSDPMRAHDFLGQLNSANWPALLVMMAEVIRDLLQELGRSTLTLSPDTSESDERDSAITSSSGPRNVWASNAADHSPSAAVIVDGQEVEVPAELEAARQLGKRLRAEIEPPNPSDVTKIADSIAKETMGSKDGEDG